MIPQLIAGSIATYLGYRIIRLYGVRPAYCKRCKQLYLECNKLVTEIQLLNKQLELAKINLEHTKYSAKTEAMLLSAKACEQQTAMLQRHISQLDSVAIDTQALVSAVSRANNYRLLLVQNMELLGIKPKDIQHVLEECESAK